MAPRTVAFLRAVMALEFVAALWLWAVGLCPWPLAGAVSTATLVMFMLTWRDTAGEEPLLCRLSGCDVSDRGPCHRCGRW